MYGINYKEIENTVMKTRLLTLTLLLMIISCSPPGKKGEIINKIKSVMQDPDSFKLRSFEQNSSTGCNETYLVSFTGKNAFGGTVRSTYLAIYKNGEYCQIADWDNGGGGWLSNSETIDVMISINGCDC